MSYDPNKLQSIASALHGLLVASNNNPDVEELFLALVDGHAQRGYCTSAQMSVESLAAMMAYLTYSRDAVMAKEIYGQDWIPPTVKGFIAFANFIAGYEKSLRRLNPKPSTHETN